MYNVTEYTLNTMRKLLMMINFALTFAEDYDMLIMLGRLSAAPFRIPEFVV